MRRNALSHCPCSGPAGEGQPGRAILLKSREQQALKNGGISISEGGRREHSEAHLVACQVHWKHRSAQSPPTHLASCVSSVCMIMIPEYPLYPFTSTHLCRASTLCQVHYWAHIIKMRKIQSLPSKDPRLLARDT